MTVRGSPTGGEPRTVLSLRRGLLDLAVAATAGDHQRGAADAERADRGDAHAQEVRPRAEPTWVWRSAGKSQQSAAFIC